MRSHFSLLGLAVIAVVFGGTATWKMLQFHARLAALENPQWERKLSAEHIYQHPVVVFGDSEIALWPMATSFGVLPVMNRGVGGDEVIGSQERFEKQVLPLDPSAVVLLIGTNDIAHGKAPSVITAAIAQMVMLARSRGETVILCSVLPARGDAASVRPLLTIQSINSSLQRLARDQGATYVDLYSAVIDQHGEFAERFSDDGLHPNAAGYLRMSKTLLPALLQSLRPEGPGR